MPSQPRPGRAPAILRAPTSHSTVMTPNAASTNRPFHFVPKARPRQIPAAQRQGRRPRKAVSAIVASARTTPSASTGSLARSRARARSRSRSRQPKAASTKNISTRSRSAVRLITRCSPSIVSSAPAKQPRNVERNMRRPIRHSIHTDAVPSTAVMKRQPKGVRPKSHSPIPMTYLPTGGCTTYAACVGMSTVEGSARICLLACSPQLTS
ncbi:hypothetical protein GA0115246_1041118 [Streptomyces sp. SolWspMP-sol7th]|nr:hypothetical protein GA0115246_1041118 [Streptomyces sp. SolWspMP-sol7th]